MKENQKNGIWAELSMRNNTTNKGMGLRSILIWNIKKEKNEF